MSPLSSSSSFSYEFTPHSLRQLKKLNKNMQKRIMERMDNYVSLNNPLLFAQKLTDNRGGTYRYRIGDYRIIFDLEDKKLVIHAVGHRREIYR